MRFTCRHASKHRDIRRTAQWARAIEMARALRLRRVPRAGGYGAHKNLWIVPSLVQQQMCTIDSQRPWRLHPGALPRLSTSGPCPSGEPGKRGALGWRRVGEPRGPRPLTLNPQGHGQGHGCRYTSAGAAPCQHQTPSRPAPPRTLGAPPLQRVRLEGHQRSLEQPQVVLAQQAAQHTCPQHRSAPVREGPAADAAAA